MTTSDATNSSERFGRNERASSNPDEMPVACPILELPNEVLSMIAARVDRRSLPALRKTCKLLCSNSTCSFIDDFIKELGIMMSRRSLQALIDISKDAEFASQVRILNIDAGFIELDSNSVLKDQHEQQCVLIRDGEGIHMLAEALNNFRRADNHFDLAIHDQTIKPIGLTDFWVGDGREWQQRSILSFNVLETLSHAVSRSHINIEELDLWIGDDWESWDRLYKPFHGWQVRPIIDMFAPLEVLRLHAVAGYGWMLRQNCHIINKLIGYGRHLRLFRLDLNMAYYFDASTDDSFNVTGRHTNTGNFQIIGWIAPERRSRAY
ncbi:hypothetical protein BDV97DRAFT_405886 [Delphinella strobiligena]|nr:hypothetical protein BDV97DRAFT_405886 [Delphinella strobiligena]